MRKTKNYLKETKMTLKNYIQISQRKGKKKSLLGIWVFSAKVQLSQHIATFRLQKIIPILKITFQLTMQWVMGVFFKYMIILQIRTRGNASFNDLSKLINTLSNQDFAGLGKFRLRESLGKMKRMHVQLVKVNKNNRNESNLNEFFSSIFLLQCQSQCQWETYQCH